MARSIIGAALGSHPAWRPPTRPPAAPIAPGLGALGGSLGGSRPNPNVSAAGGAILGPGAGTLSRPPAPPAPAAPPAAPPTHPVTSTVTPSPPDLSGNNWEGYLSPDQLGNLRQAGISYGDQVAGWQRRASDAQTSYNQQIANDQFAHDVNTARANEEMAARGLSISSIRANDLTDINRTLTDATAAATASLNTLISDATAAIGNLQTGAGGTLGASWASTQNQYQGDAAINAAGMAQFQPYQVTNMVPDAAPPPPPAPAVNPAIGSAGQAGLAAGALTRGQGGADGGTQARIAKSKSIIGKAIAGHPNWRGR